MLAFRALACVCVVFVFAGCGGGGGDDSGAPAPTYGACEFPMIHECIEVTGSARDVANEHGGCTMGSGTWSSDPCPITSDLIGCCDYTLGPKFHECFYQGTSRQDPVGYCTNSTLWSDGVWTPAGS